MREGREREGGRKREGRERVGGKEMTEDDGQVEHLSIQHIFR